MLNIFQILLVGISESNSKILLALKRFWEQHMIHNRKDEAPESTNQGPDDSIVPKG